MNALAPEVLSAYARARLERLCRYLCRPPIAQDRLEVQPNGKLRHSYSFKFPTRPDLASGSGAMMRPA